MHYISPTNNLFSLQQKMANNLISTQKQFPGLAATIKALLRFLNKLPKGWPTI